MGIQAITYPNSFLLGALFTSIVLTTTLLFDSFNDEKIKDKDMNRWQHIIVLFCQVLAISLFTSYLMYFIFYYGSGNFTPCQKTINCKKISKSIKIPHFFNIIVMILCFIIPIIILKKVNLKFNIR